MFDAAFWISASVAICLALGLGQKHPVVRRLLYGIAALCLLMGVFRIVHPNQLTAPSMAITDVRLYANPITHEVCVIPYLKNTGTALAHVEFFQHQLTIAGVQQPPGSPDVDIADFAANGGVNHYKLCTRDPEAFRQVEIKGSIQINFGFRYHGDSGPTQSLCLNDNQWNYNLNAIEGNDKPCDVSMDNALDTTMWWAGMIFGAFIFAAVISLLVIQF